MILPSGSKALQVLPLSWSYFWAVTASITAALLIFCNCALTLWLTLYLWGR